MLNGLRARIRQQADQLSAFFRDSGALSIEVASLQPAETLLDLYGEDIRARAYVTHDAVNGEQMLRPDFTVPVAQMHMQDGAEPARYTYQGPVWRKQEPGSPRAPETLQVGFELFDRSDPSTSDAEVFLLFYKALSAWNLRAATGDMGILMAAVNGLSTIERRKAALRRHLWRPARFRQLLERFGGADTVAESRKILLQAAAETPMAKLCARAGVHVGLRSVADITARVEALQEDAAADPIPAQEVALLETILTLREKSTRALKHLRGLEPRMPALGPALDRMEARLEALAASGIDIEALDFEASYGRTTLEYYDGFVFGFYAADRPDLPVIASGGRYDALTERLGQGRGIPAVGGVIRPEFILALGGGV